MKKYLLFLLALVFITSCEMESYNDLQLNEQETYEDVSADILGEKRDVCHNGQIRNVSIDALPDHQGHGDAVDWDDDGYFSAENDCGMPIDCDDTDAAINPEADEDCTDGIDNNCNNEIDEGCIPAIVLNGRTWTAENLNINVSGSICYDNDPANCTTYGRMYNFEEAQTACVALGAGWRVPTKSEWDAMILSFGGIGAAPGSAYDELINGGTSGFNALLGGYEQDGNFQNLGLRGRYWSRTESGSFFAWQYQFISSLGILGVSDNLKISRRSCRCILD